MFILFSVYPTEGTQPQQEEGDQRVQRHPVSSTLSEWSILSLHPELSVQMVSRFSRLVVTDMMSVCFNGLSDSAAEPEVARLAGKLPWRSN